MKKWFKIIFTVLLIGWLPFAFLAAWGQFQPVPVRLIIAFTGFFICLFGMVGMISLTTNKNWWLSLKELETKQESYDMLIKEALDVRDTLTRKILREDRDDNFIVTALNAHWNEANTQLQRNDLGDIERKAYEFQLKESKRIMKERA